MVVIFTGYALIGVANIATKIYGHRHLIAVWAPSLFGVLLIMALAGGGAVRALRAARIEARASAGKANESRDKIAFQKFKTYFYCAASIGIAMQVLILFWRAVSPF
jgi:hypothetical protein